jgi:hypothetical protein
VRKCKESFYRPLGDWDEDTKITYRILVGKPAAKPTFRRPRRWDSTIEPDVGMIDCAVGSSLKQAETRCMYNEFLK